MLGIITYRFGNVQASTPGVARRTVVHRSKSGRWFFGARLAMALVSLAVAPGVFGTFGILMGMAAVLKGERYLGMLGGRCQRRVGRHRVLYRGGVSPLGP